MFAVVITAVLATGCSATASKPDPSAFLTAVRAEAPDAEFLTDEQILVVGEDVCSQLVEGKTIEDFENSEPGVTDETRERIAIMQRAAAEHLCPSAT
nr:DUF732 domain-containing protein [Arthrobacter pigmenti]